MHSTYTLLLAAAALASSTNAFWDKGHLLIARQAQALLEVNDPASLDAALDILSILKQSNPDLTSSENNHPFTECASFADEIKGKGYSWQSDWHFIDQPYLADGGSIEDYPDFQMSDVDVLDALSSLTAFLKGSSASNSYIDQIQSAFSDEGDQKSFALRLVIHYVGDLHQPLHAVSEVDNEYPKGDRGGNSEWINPNVEGVGNLHSVWDSVIYQETGYETLPLSDSSWDWYTSTVSDVSSQYPVEEEQLHAGEFQVWADESLQMAKDYVYADFVNHELPSDEYKEAAKPVLEARMVYAGARLATLITDIFSNSSAEELSALYLQ